MPSPTVDMTCYRLCGGNVTLSRQLLEFTTITGKLGAGSSSQIGNVSNRVDAVMDGEEVACQYQYLVKNRTSLAQYYL